jgi:hypothetical protein
LKYESCFNELESLLKKLPSNATEQQKQKLLNQYVLAQNLISQKENAQALNIMQSVYNSSNGALEVLALTSIMDLLLQDNQPQAVEKLLVEVLTLKQEPEIMLILYSKCLNILQTLKTKKQISNENAQKISHDFQESLQKQKVPNDFTPYKTALLLAFSSDSSVTTENLPQNELTTILQLIEYNKQ